MRKVVLLDDHLIVRSVRTDASGSLLVVIYSSFF